MTSMSTSPPSSSAPAALELPLVAMPACVREHAPDGDFLGYKTGWSSLLSSAGAGRRATRFIETPYHGEMVPAVHTLMPIAGAELALRRDAMRPWLWHLMGDAVVPPESASAPAAGTKVQVVLSSSPVSSPLGSPAPGEAEVQEAPNSDDHDPASPPQDTVMTPPPEELHISNSEKTIVKTEEKYALRPRKSGKYSGKATSLTHAEKDWIKAHCNLYGLNDLVTLCNAINSQRDAETPPRPHVPNRVTVSNYISYLKKQAQAAGDANVFIRRRAPRATAGVLPAQADTAASAAPRPPPLPVQTPRGQRTPALAPDAPRARRVIVLRKGSQQSASSSSSPAAAAAAAATGSLQPLAIKTEEETQEMPSASSSQRSTVAAAALSAAEAALQGLPALKSRGGQWI